MGYRNLKKKISEHNNLKIYTYLLQKGDSVLPVPDGQKT